MIGLIPLFLAGAYVGWNIGANDAGNCIGTSVGSGLISYRHAILLVSVSAVAGALLQGGRVMETVGRGIVISDLSSLAVFATMISAGLFVTAATLLRLPVSTSQAIVGGLAGVGFAAGADVDTMRIASIAEVWVICPILVGLMAVAIYSASVFVLRRLREDSVWQRIPNALLILSACYISFSLGANHVGTAMGPITNLGIQPSWLALLGGVAVAAGAMTFGSRVTQTVGSGITPLGPVSAYSAQAAAAVAVHFFSIVGIPVSTSQAIVGAVVGVGLVHGLRTVRKGRIAGIAVGWVATPTAAGLFSFGLYRLLALVFGEG
jgi:PiT family inorganic phosphate transporter